MITGGWPAVEGATILEKRAFARTHHDALRRALMWEPRGHADMYGCLLTEPATDDGDVGVLFLHNEGWSTMCGHGIIALVTVALEHGLLADPGREIRIDTPAGRVTATAHRSGDRVERVTFVNVPSFVLASDLVVPVEGYGDVRSDIAFGGAFYAYVSAADVGVEIARENVSKLIEAGMRIKRGVSKSHEIRHPGGASDLDFLYGTIFVGPAAGDAHSRNVCIFADGEVDRSPTGTGVSGRAAIHVARGELAIGEAIAIESVIGTSFTVRAVSRTRVGEVDAIVPEVSGSAWVTGHHEFVIDPRDPQAAGFLLR